MSVALQNFKRHFLGWMSEALSNHQIKYVYRSADINVLISLIRQLLLGRFQRKTLSQELTKDVIYHKHYFREIKQE